MTKHASGHRIFCSSADVDSTVILNAGVLGEHRVSRGWSTVPDTGLQGRSRGARAHPALSRSLPRFRVPSPPLSSASGFHSAQRRGGRRLTVAPATTLRAGWLARSTVTPATAPPAAGSGGSPHPSACVSASSLWWRRIRRDPAILEPGKPTRGYLV